MQQSQVLNSEEMEEISYMYTYDHIYIYMYISYDTYHILYDRYILHSFRSTFSLL